MSHVWCSPDTWFSPLQVCGAVRSQKSFIGMVYSQLRGSGRHQRRIHQISSVICQRGGQPVAGTGAGCQTSRFRTARSRQGRGSLGVETRADKSRSSTQKSRTNANRKSRTNANRKRRMSANTIMVIATIIQCPIGGCQGGTYKQLQTYATERKPKDFYIVANKHMIWVEDTV